MDKLVRVTAAVFLWMQAARAANCTDFTISYDKQLELVTFTLTWDAPPRFFTVDQPSTFSPEDEFQFYITPGKEPWYYPGAMLLRGSEIRKGNALVIRDTSPPDPDPNASGWGSRQGSVPVKLFGNVVSFSIPENLLGISTTQRSFSFRFEWYYYGCMRGLTHGNFVAKGNGELTILL